MSFATIGLIALTYFAAHIVRALRLYLLGLDNNGDAKNFVLIHFVTALPAALMPWRTGELLRVFGFSTVTQPKIKGLVVWGIERFGDALSILVLLLVLSSALQLRGSQYLTTLLLLFAAVILLATAFAIEGVPFLRNYLITRSRSSRGMKILPFIVFLDDTIAEIKNALIGRVTIIIVLSLLVWMLEFSSILLGAMWIQGIALDQIDVTSVLLFSADSGYRLGVLITVSSIGLMMLLRRVLIWKRRNSR